MAPDFFISYTKADTGWAEWIAWQLEAAGYTTTLQAWDFLPGRDWVHEMQRAATQAGRILAVLSSDYLRSVHGEAEWRVAYAADPTGEKGLLVPVRVAACEPPGLLASRVYVDLVGVDEDDARSALLRGIAKRRAKPTLEPAFPGRRAPRFPLTRGPAHDADAQPKSVDEEVSHLRELLRIHERNVRILEQKQASYAGEMPVYLVTQLEDEQNAVDELRRRLEEAR